MTQVTFGLKENFVLKNYKFINSTFNGCLYFPGFDLIDTKNSSISETKHNFQQRVHLIPLKSHSKTNIIFSCDTITSICYFYAL